MSVNSSKDLLKLLKKGGSYTEAELIKCSGKSRATVRRWLQQLKWENGIDREIPPGDNKYHYSWTPALIDIVEEIAFDLPKTTPDKPFHIDVKDPDNFGLGLANTVYAGSKPNQASFRNFLRLAEARELDAILITGNSLWIDTTRYSKLKPDRTRTTDIHIDPDLINYPEAVVLQDRDPKSILAKGTSRPPVFLTFKEKLDMIIRHSLQPLFIEEDGTPLYSGQILLTFGEMEEELVRQHVNEVVRMARKREEGYINRALAALRDEYRQINAELKGSPNNRSLLSSRDQILDDIEDWETYRTRVIMTNIDDGYISHADRQMMGYIIAKLEKAIPNSKIISTGEAYVEFGGRVGRIIPNPHKKSKKPKDSLMDKLMQKVTADLHQGGKRIDFAVGGGLSPSYSKEPIASRSRKGKHTTLVMQLPTCLDINACEELATSRVRVSGNDLVELPLDPNFMAATYALRYVNGLAVTEEYREEFLTNEIFFGEGQNPTSYQLSYKAVLADQHHGSKYVTTVKVPVEREIKKRKITVEEEKYAHAVAQQMLREIDAPLIAIFSVGDELQEKNYATEVEGHPDILQPATANKALEELMNQEGIGAEKIIAQVVSFAKSQILRRGIPVPMDQLHDYLNQLDFELIQKTIERADKAGYFGPSYLLVNGNHNLRTVDGMYTTSQMLAREIKMKLGCSVDDIVMGEHKLQRVMAPMLGTEGIYTGVFGIAPELRMKGDYLEQDLLLEAALQHEQDTLYAMYARHKQHSSKVGDRMKGSRDAFLKRGQAFTTFENKNYIVLSAHDHMGGQTSSKKGLHLRAYCFMGRNAFGDARDYGAPTEGFFAFGLPRGGLANGPIVTVEFPIEQIERWAKEKPEINTRELFHNSIIY